MNEGMYIAKHGLDAFRAHMAAKTRAKRARRRIREGRSATGHPTDCPCYDCLWGGPVVEGDARTARTGRFLGAS